MDSGSSRRWILRVAVLLFVGCLPLQVDAQACDPLTSWIVSFGCNGRFDTGRTICVNGRAVCQLACNNNSDCGDASQACMSGVCENALVACNNNTDCPPGFGCNGGTGVCAPCSTAGVTCGPVDPCAGIVCDDGIACNGTETCAAGRCVPGTPPDCNDQNPATNDRCIEAGVREGVAQSRCDNYTPSKCDRRPGTGEVRLTPVGSRSVGVRWSGSIQGDFSSQPASMRILLTDGTGAPLIDATAGTDNGSWRARGSGWTWTPRARDSQIRKVTLSRNGTYRVDADFGAAALNIGRITQPDGVALIDFVAPDTADICTGIPKLECVPGRYGMQCRTRFIGGPNP